MPDSEEVRTVVGEVLTAAKPGAVVVEMTTHSPQVARELAERARSSDVEYLDCPAGGGIAAVRAGALAFWAGGSEAAVERARPVLAAIGAPERLRHCGPVGSGLVVKLLNNYLVAVSSAASGEALALAREAGVDVRTAIEAVVSGGGGANAQLANLYPNRVLAGDFEAGFKLGYMVKDLRHAFDLAAELGVESPLGRAAGARMDEAAERYGTEVDFGSVSRLSGW
ncbi:NAD(P)-dependent oxidoreductase [Streptomyces anulatus]|uniref:NAD(P)-dependent oxidoreductase n=1 Tax=Streptomyces anulatus TaxID=1892 RepID=UPI002DDB0B50|nr:NAD(P)-dependent oxidoreductase [Streptomyces anulatus]WSC64680.1 NAD(P)-dependent oxidoreductase [Streptomyces anulatus]